MMCGAMVSSTVTKAVALLVFPFTSVAVSVTCTFESASEQLKLLKSSANDAIPHASLLALSIMAGVMLTMPIESKYTVML